MSLRFKNSELEQSYAAHDSFSRARSDSMGMLLDGGLWMAGVRRKIFTLSIVEIHPGPPLNKLIIHLAVLLCSSLPTTVKAV
jgi:hypothetical protein